MIGIHEFHYKMKGNMLFLILCYIILYGVCADAVGAPSSGEVNNTMAPPETEPSKTSVSSASSGVTQNMSPKPEQTPPETDSSPWSTILESFLRANESQISQSTGNDDGLCSTKDNSNIIKAFFRFLLTLNGLLCQIDFKKLFQPFEL